MPPLVVEFLAATTPSIDDDAWEDSLNFVEEKQANPVIGPELMVLQTEAGSEDRYTLVARSLAGKQGDRTGGAAELRRRGTSRRFRPRVWRSETSSVGVVIKLKFRMDRHVASLLAMTNT
jgi:hypothetical protein